MCSGTADFVTEFQVGDLFSFVSALHRVYLCWFFLVRVTQMLRLISIPDVELLLLFKFSTDWN